jgi:hypothetical protein
MYPIRAYIKEIFEFASERKYAIQELRNLSRPFAEHVCKLFLWGSQNEDWKKDWSEEIWNYISQASSILLKGSKRLKASDYKENFFACRIEAEWEMEKRLESTAFHFQDGEGYPAPNTVNAEDAYKQYKEFVNQIMPSILNNKVRLSEVKDLCNKYLV